MTKIITKIGSAWPFMSSFEFAVMLRRRKALTRQMKLIMAELGEQRMVLEKILDAKRAEIRKAKQDNRANKCRRILEARLSGIPWSVICANEHNCLTVARKYHSRAIQMVRTGRLRVSNNSVFVQGDGEARS